MEGGRLFLFVECMFFVYIFFLRVVVMLMAFILGFIYVRIGG